MQSFFTLSAMLIRSSIIVMLLLLLRSEGQRPVTNGNYQGQMVQEDFTEAYTLSDISAGYMISKAFVNAYPGLIAGPVWKNGDWVLRVRGKEFYWAFGRLLSAKAKSEPNYLQRYSAYRIYEYQEELPPVTRRAWFYSSSFYDEQLWRGLRRIGRRSRSARNIEFFQTLVNTSKRSDMVKQNAVKTTFLGRPITVHRMLLLPLARIQRELEQKRKEDKELNGFLNSLRSVSAYVWRNIAGSRRRSLHSYGIAVDLIPWRWNGIPYWLWVQQNGLDWHNYPYEKRWQLPDIVIQTFEKHGFTWGGRWYMFDNMHFEYHPELRQLKPYFQSLKNG